MSTSEKGIYCYDGGDACRNMIVARLCDLLTYYDAKTVQPKSYACTSWEINDHADLFMFHLVSDTKFHSGEAVDIEAFKRVGVRMVNPACRLLSNTWMR